MQHFKELNTGSHISLAAGDKKCKLECLLNMVGIADVSGSYLL
jgi:soluble P-type ATPase